MVHFQALISKNSTDFMSKNVSPASDPDALDADPNPANADLDAKNFMNDVLLYYC
jgi:hypothetical protein